MLHAIDLDEILADDPEAFRRRRRRCRRRLGLGGLAALVLPPVGQVALPDLVARLAAVL